MTVKTLDEKGLVELSASDKIVAKLQPYMELKVLGLDDKEGLQKVHEARMEVRRHRIDVEKARKKLKEDSLDYGRRVDAEAKRITGLLEPIESYLEEQESIVEREKERLRQIEEQKKREKLKDRLDKLAKVGAMRDPSIVAAIPDEAFNSMLENAEREFEAKLKREAEEAAERDRQNELLRIERDRIEAERKQQEEERRKLAAEQEAINAERRRIDAEKQKAEQEERMRLAKIEAEKVAIERARVEAELKEKAEQKRLADERERLAAEEALKPDLQKLIDFANAIDALPIPVLKTKKALAFVSSMKIELTTLTNKIRSFN